MATIFHFVCYSVQVINQVWIRDLVLNSPSLTIYWIETWRMNGHRLFIFLVMQTNVISKQILLVLICPEFIQIFFLFFNL